MPRRRGIKTYRKRRSSHISVSSIATLNETALGQSASSDVTSTQNKSRCTDAPTDFSQMLSNHNHSSLCEFNTSSSRTNLMDDCVAMSSGNHYDINDSHGMTMDDLNCNGENSSPTSIPTKNMRECNSLSNNSNKLTVDMSSHFNYSDGDDRQLVSSPDKLNPGYSKR